MSNLLRPVQGLGPTPAVWVPGFFKVKQTKGLLGTVIKYAAQEISLIATEIAEKGYLWMDTG